METKAMKTSEILCHECGERCKIKIENFKILLYDCKNGHRNDNIEFEQFKEIQNQIHNKKLSCDYQNFCKIHNEQYVSFCNKCNKNLCSKCEKEHKNENEIVIFKNITPDLNEKSKENFDKKIKKAKNDIKILIDILTKMNNKINIYHEIYNNTINEFDINNTNFQMINNINEIINYIDKIIEIINENEINNIFNNIKNIFDKKEKKLGNYIKYKIKKGEKKIKLFGNNFVDNNKENCKIIYIVSPNYFCNFSKSPQKQS